MEDFNKCARKLIIEYIRIRVRPFYERRRTPEEIRKLRAKSQHLRDYSSNANQNVTDSSVEATKDTAAEKTPSQEPTNNDITNDL
jgi:hypothetical protein